MEFKLPEMGEGVHEGELVKWRVKEGDAVKDDQPLCEVMTDKATIEVPSPFSGKVTALMAKEGQMVSVGQSLLSYEGGGASKGAAATSVASPPIAAANGPAPSATPAHTQKPAAMTAAPTTSSATAASRSSSGAAASSQGAMAAGSADWSPVLASPSTRRIAREAGVSLSNVPATGPHGRILREDLERFLSGGGSARPVTTPNRGGTTHPTGGEQRIPLKGLRRKIAEKMRLSKDKAAHFTFVEEADVSALVKLRNEAKVMGAEQGVKVTYLPFLMKAMVAALRQYPMLNATLDEGKDEIVYKHYFNISLSIQTDEGLTAPVIKNVEHKSIFELARDIEAVVTRAREKKLTREDFEGGTITLTNAGTIGGLFTTPIINFPEVAILAFNKIFRRPVARTIKGVERVVIRDWTYFSISLDHRIVDGANAAEFMKLFIKYVENPGLLVLDSF